MNDVDVCGMIKREAQYPPARHRPNWSTARDPCPLGPWTFHMAHIAVVGPRYPCLFVLFSLCNAAAAPALVATAICCLDLAGRGCGCGTRNSHPTGRSAYVLCYCVPRSAMYRDSVQSLESVYLSCYVQLTVPRVCANLVSPPSYSPSLPKYHSCSHNASRTSPRLSNSFPCLFKT